MATKEKTGVVVSTKMEKTIVLSVEEKYAHPVYGKILKKTKRFMAHDAQNECALGDTVLISETRPLSRNKCWAVKQILNKREISN